MAKSGNTARSVVYGWTGLTVATAFAFFFAKKEIDQRRRERPDRHKRTELTPSSLSNTGVTGADPDQGRTNLQTTTPGKAFSAEMQSRPTGVDTATSSAHSQAER